MKKIIKIIAIAILLIVIVFAYQLLHFDNRYFVDTNTYQNYKPTTSYEQTYLVGDYVEEKMNTFAIKRSMILGSMANFDKIIAEDKIIDKASHLIDVWSDRKKYTNFIQNNQYVEKTPISIKYVGQQYDHNFEYQGILEDDSNVTGNIAIWKDDNGISTAISFQDKNGQIDKNKALLLTDDSNAEMLAYLIIETIQSNLNTNYEPDEAASKFFNCSLEEMAGSISYHAATSLYSTENTIGDKAFEKVKTANISTKDADGFLVNQAY